MCLPFVERCTVAFCSVPSQRAPRGSTPLYTKHTKPLMRRDEHNLSGAARSSHNTGRSLEIDAVPVSARFPDWRGVFTLKTRPSQSVFMVISDFTHHRSGGVGSRRCRWEENCWKQSLMWLILGKSLHESTNLPLGFMFFCFCKRIGKFLISEKEHRLHQCLLPEADLWTALWLGKKEIHN